MASCPHMAPAAQGAFPQGSQALPRRGHVTRPCSDPIGKGPVLVPGDADLALSRPQWLQVMGLIMEKALRVLIFLGFWFFGAPQGEVFFVLAFCRAPFALTAGPKKSMGIHGTMILVPSTPMGQRPGEL